MGRSQSRRHIIIRRLGRSSWKFTQVACLTPITKRFQLAKNSIMPCSTAHLAKIHQNFADALRVARRKKLSISGLLPAAEKWALTQNARKWAKLRRLWTSSFSWRSREINNGRISCDLPADEGDEITFFILFYCKYGWGHSSNSNRFMIHAFWWIISITLLS